uniref:Uncharacterized protein n=1 Tax=Mus spicilegus TaxID=10103 RepID=A0A8C6GT65_MUSSI
MCTYIHTYSISSKCSESWYVRNAEYYSVLRSGEIPLCCAFSCISSGVSVTVLLQHSQLGFLFSSSFLLGFCFVWLDAFEYVTSHLKTPKPQAFSPLLCFWQL